MWINSSSSCHLVVDAHSICLFNSFHVFLSAHNSITVNTIQITFQMQIDNPESSLTPPTPISPLPEVHSPEALASISSGSSDNASGKIYYVSLLLLLFICCWLAHHMFSVRVHFIYSFLALLVHMQIEHMVSRRWQCKSTICELQTCVCVSVWGFTYVLCMTTLVV